MFEPSDTMQEVSGRIYELSEAKFRTSDRCGKASDWWRSRVASALSNECKRMGMMTCASSRQNWLR
jgi:hypothetical protein